jgi:tetratricopeptide (TPR) repeat protein
MNAAESMFAEARKLHQAGRLSEAEQLYRRVINTAPDHADSLHWLGVIALQAGHLDAAAELIGKAIAIQGNAPVYHSNLGLVRQQQGKLDQSAACFERALALRPGYAEARNNLGVTLQRQEKFAEAMAQFDHALKLKPDYVEAARNLANLHFMSGNAAHRAGRLDAAIDHYARAAAATPGFVEAQFNLGNALRDRGDLELARAAYERALTQNPRLVQAYLALGVVLLIQDRLDEAATRFRQALEIDATLAEGHYNLAIALMGLSKVDEAIAAFQEAITLKPQFAAAHFNLAKAFADRGQAPEAAVHYQKTLALSPKFARAHMALGNLYLAEGDMDGAHVHFREAQRLEPVRKQAAIKPVPDFSVLALTAPGAVNTPTEYLMSRVGFETHAVLLLPGVTPDIADLQTRADVVINLIAEADSAREALLAAADLADRLERPVVNHPRKILLTDRATVAERLRTIPACRVARTVLLGPGEHTVPNDQLSFPVLARVAGSHGGKHFKKCDDAAALTAALQLHPEAAHYVCEYLPYESADGLFRKYRLIFAGDEILPYHLAIGRQWKMHYFSSDMAQEQTLRAEEEAFLRNPRNVFGPQLWSALEAVRTTLELDFAGIDCGIDSAGRLVVFEANATMLVHDEKGLFAYKAPFIFNIKQAFERMLSSHVARG